MTGLIPFHGDVEACGIKGLPRLNLIGHVDAVIHIGLLVIHVQEPAHMIGIARLHIAGLVIEDPYSAGFRLGHGDAGRMPTAGDGEGPGVLVAGIGQITAFDVELRPSVDILHIVDVVVESDDGILRRHLEDADIHPVDEKVDCF